MSVLGDTNMIAASSTKNAASAVELKNLTIRYGTDSDDETRQHIAVEGIDLSLVRGEIVAIVGKSGCGKTSLINAIAGLLENQEVDGTVLVNGRPSEEQREDMAYMFARDALLPWRNARRNVELPLERKVARAERRQRATAMLERVGLGNAVNRLPHELSQGMRQRAALARTLVTEPSLILADEPFAALDAQTRLDVQSSFLREWESAGTSVILVTHDLQEAILLADRVVVMVGSPGRILIDQAVELPRPRADQLGDIVTSNEFRGMYHQLFELIREHS